MGHLHVSHGRFPRFLRSSQTTYMYFRGSAGPLIVIPFSMLLLLFGGNRTGTAAAATTAQRRKKRRSGGVVGTPEVLPELGALLTRRIQRMIPGRTSSRRAESSRASHSHAQETQDGEHSHMQTRLVGWSLWAQHFPTIILDVFARFFPPTRHLTQ